MRVCLSIIANANGSNRARNWMLLDWTIASLLVWSRKLHKMRSWNTQKCALIWSCLDMHLCIYWIDFSAAAVVVVFYSFLEKMYWFHAHASKWFPILRTFELWCSFMMIKVTHRSFSWTKSWSIVLIAPTCSHSVQCVIALNRSLGLILHAIHNKPIQMIFIYGRQMKIAA